jgi:CubicO group peptidase (beta-lactamase class C family)
LGWSFGVLVLALAAGARAEAPFFTLHGASGFYSPGGVPDEAFKMLGKVAEGGGEIKCFAFTMDGGSDWVFLFGDNGYHTSNTNLPVCKKLSELRKDGGFKCVAFAPTGGWTILWSTNGSWTEGEVPEGAFKKMGEVIKKGGELRSVAYGPKGAWVLLYNKTDVAYGDVPEKLAEALDEARKDHVHLRCVAFTGHDWVCLSDKKFWTSNPNLPSAKQVAQAIKDKNPAKWLAIIPTFAPHHFEKWAQRIHDTYDGKTAGGYVFVVWDHGRVAASASYGWARAPWEKENPSLKWGPDVPMQTCSLTKPITAVALLKLWEDSQGTDHAFSLDDPFLRFLPKKFQAVAHDDMKKVTIRQLLLHTSGIVEKGEAMPDDLEKLLKRPLANPPGKVGNYQNVNYYLARRVLEGAGKVEYGPYVKEHVLKPMGITRMELQFDENLLACGYAKTDKPKAPGDPFWGKNDVTAGPGGWFGTANEMGKFLEGIRTHKVLNEATTKMMLKQNLGWDYSDPGSTKGGLVINGVGQLLGCRATLFPDGITAVIFGNAAPPKDEGEPIADGWLRDRGK